MVVQGAILGPESTFDVLLGTGLAKALQANLRVLCHAGKTPDR